MDRKRTFEKTANSCFNLGLERARLGDLSGACTYLKKSLRFNKYQTDSRNLLGLIYYEMGETADALVQWVISLNLNPSPKNRADYYLGQVQRKPEQLDRASAAVKRYNQALYQAQNGGDDFAVIELTHMLKDNPSFVKANILLALLLLKKDDNAAAGRYLMQVLKIDRNNPSALILMDEVKKRTGKAEVEKKKMEEAFSHRIMADDDVIIPETRRQATAGQVVGYLAAGIAVGILSFYLLVLPGIRKKIIVSTNQRVAENSRLISDLNGDKQRLTRENEAVKTELAEKTKRLEAFEAENTGFLSTFRSLSSLIEEYESGDIYKAAEAYLVIDREQVTEEPLTGLLEQIDRYMPNQGFDRLLEKGTNNWNEGNLDVSEKYYNMALKIREDEPEALYLKARLLQYQNRTTEANKIFDKIIGEHPESPYADKAVTARGY